MLTSSAPYMALQRKACFPAIRSLNRFSSVTMIWQEDTPWESRSLTASRNSSSVEQVAVWGSVHDTSSSVRSPFVL